MQLINLLTFRDQQLALMLGAEMLFVLDDMSTQGLIIDSFKSFIYNKRLVILIDGEEKKIISLDKL